jgi:hypothetical protein
VVKWGSLIRLASVVGLVVGVAALATSGGRSLRSRTDKVPTATTTLPLAPGAVGVTVLFTQGQGGCPGFPATLGRPFQLTRVGAVVTLLQPTVHDTALGTIAPSGTIRLDNGAEHYLGASRWPQADGSYRVTDPRTRCTETYHFRLTPGCDPALSAAGGGWPCRQ